jgi:hypothetical protein
MLLLLTYKMTYKSLKSILLLATVDKHQTVHMNYM